MSLIQNSYNVHIKFGILKKIHGIPYRKEAEEIPQGLSDTVTYDPNDEIRNHYFRFRDGSKIEMIKISASNYRFANEIRSKINGKSMDQRQAWNLIKDSL